jgi:hypothetical protein
VLQRAAGALGCIRVTGSGLLLEHREQRLVLLQSLPMSTLKVVNFSALQGKALVFWRVFFQHFLLGFTNMAALEEVVSRAAGKSELQNNLIHFFKWSVGPWVASANAAERFTDEEQQKLLLRVRRAERVLGWRKETMQSTL